MARAKTTFKPGQSGNPAGRPPKLRALTEALAEAGARPIEIDGQQVIPNQMIGAALWQCVATGRIELPSGLKMTVEPKEWLDVVKWLYAQIDGPPKQGPSGDADDPLHYKLYAGVDPEQV